MAKQVPLTTELNQTLDVGSAVQFSAGSVEPMQNKTPTAISKQSTALLQAQKAAQGLADQLNDAEATKLYNEFYPELENNHNTYTDIKGFDAVAPIAPEKEDGEYTNTLDVYKNTNLEVLRDKYSERASNGSVKFMFEAKAHQAIADSQNKMTQHSIKQQKIGATEVLAEHLEITKKEIVGDYEKWNVDGSVYQTRKFVGLALIDEVAMVNGWNIDATKGRVSSQYLDLRSKYLYEVATGVLDKMKLNGIDPKQREKYIQNVYGDFGEKTADKHLEINEKEGKLHKLSACVEATLRDNGNTNDGSYISSANKLYCLSSSNSFDDGKNASVTQGLHSDEVDTTEKTISDNMEMTEQILNSESKFYRPDSELNGTLMNQHKTTHMFAALHLGVPKADSLYTKAKSQVDIDLEQFKNNPVYAKNINAKIITNYKNLIIEEATKKYKPEIVKLQNEIKKLEATPNVSSSSVTSLGPLPGTKAFENQAIDNKKKKKIKQLKNQLELANLEDPKFVEKIVADLNILEEEIDYNYDSQITSELKIDEVSGLQPLSVLEQKLKATIQDPEELKVALKDLRTKYNDITNASNELYEQNLNKATTIAFAREGGHKDLIENGININDFKEEDQKKLINGQPENSDVNTILMLRDNQSELQNNLNKYSFKLNKLDYMKLEEYAATLDSEQKVVAVRSDKKLLNLYISKYGFDDIINEKKGDKEANNNYLELHVEWERLIDEAQIANGNKTISREKKIALLERLLDDEVFTGEKTGGFLGFGSKDVTQPRSTFTLEEKDGAYVNVYGNNIQLSSINSFMRDLIKQRLEAKGQIASAYNIAQMWVDIGKPTADNKYDYEIYKRNFKGNKVNNNSNEIIENNENNFSKSYIQNRLGGIISY